MLFYIVPKDSDPFDNLFKIELAILALDYVAVAVYVLMIHRAACHINLKLLSLFLLLQYALYISSRIIVVFTQKYFLSHPDEPSAPTPLIIVCSFYQAYYYILILTMPFWMSFERILARHFMEDYNIRTRSWIPTVIIPCAILYCCLGSAIFTFEWIFMDLALPLIVDIGGALAGAGIWFIGIGYGYTIDFYREVKKFSEVQSVIVRFRERNKIKMRTPLEQNLFSTKHLINACIYTVVLVATSALGFIAAFHYPYYELKNRHIADCSFHIFIALYAPLVTFIGLCFNKYTRNIIRSVFCDPKFKYRQEPSLKIFAVQSKVEITWSPEEAAEALARYLPAIRRAQRRAQRAIADSFRYPGRPIEE